MAFKCFSSSEKRKTFRCKVVLLDDTQLIQELSDTAHGQDLLDIVCKHLNLLETAYFGLRFIDTNGQPRWLDAARCINKQLKDPMTLYFNVKFYASDPCKLVEEITRYQFFLQAKQDILQSRLPVPFELAAELFALAVQSELGDFDPRHHQDGYVSEFRFLANQSTELERRVTELHKGLSGQVPATSEMNFLERVKWLDLYGADLHPVLGDDNVEYFLALAPSGIIVLRNRSKVGNYYWPRIVKVYRKGKHFMTRVVEKTNDEHTYGFRLPSKEACKHLWQCCTEHQAFFKLSQDKESLMKRGSLSTIAHRFRNSIRRSSLTRGANGQVNLAHDRAPPTVVRVPSRRYQRRMGQPDGADALNGHAVGKDESYKENGYIEVRSSIVVPAGRHVTQPVIYRTSSVPGPLNEPSKTSPWDNPRQRGLFSSSTNASPRSVRSAYMARPQHERCDVDNNANHVNQRRNSSSSHHRHRQSDVESQVSKCSKSSHRSHRSSRSSSSHHRCRRRHENESGTESDSSRKRHRRRHRCCEKTGSTHKLVDSEQQWLEIQRRQLEQQAAGQFDGPRAGVAVVRELAPTGRHISGYGSGHESESEVNGSSSLSRAKRRTKALSENGRSRDIIMPREVKKHIQYDLVEPTEIDKNDIRYTKVETESRLFKIRYSPKTGRARGKLTNDIKQNSAGSTDSKSNEEDSVAQFTPPPNMIYTRNGNYNGSAFNQDSNETASCSNSTASVGHNESSPSGNMFRPVKPNDWSAQISQAYGTLNAQRQYRKTSSDDSDLLDDTSGQRSRKPFIDNHYTNMLNYESGYGSGSTPRVVTFQSPPSTTAYYSSDQRTAYKSDFIAGKPNDGFRTPSEMATEL